ncbi:hypothetical protein Ddc_08038 [Ditylenchus destructor]|nr:hypothetical protein Ddc_08038 [Ditylenchus destructor]
MFFHQTTNLLILLAVYGAFGTVVWESISAALRWLCQCQLAAFGRSNGGFVSANSRPSAARTVALSVPTRGLRPLEWWLCQCQAWILPTFLRYRNLADRCAVCWSFVGPRGAPRRSDTYPTPICRAPENLFGSLYKRKGSHHLNFENIRKGNKHWSNSYGTGNITMQVVQLVEDLDTTQDAVSNNGSSNSKTNHTEPSKGVDSACGTAKVNLCIPLALLATQKVECQ